MRDHFILLLVVIFLSLSVTSRLAGLYTYWWFGIFRPHDWIWGSLLTDLKTPLLAAILFVVPSFIQNITPKVDNSLAVLMVVFFVLEVIANLLNGCSVLPIRVATIDAVFILFYVVLLTARLLTDYKKLFWLILIVGVSIAFHSGKAGLNAIVSGSSSYGQNNLTGLFSGSNAFALGSGMLLFFMILCLQFINSPLFFPNPEKWYSKPILLKIYKIFFILMIVGTFYNIVSLESRGSFLATCAGLFVWILLHKKRVKILSITIIVIILGHVVIPLPEGYTDRIMSVFADEDERDNSAASRPYFWKVARQIASDHPLGVGPGCYPLYYNDYDRAYGSFRSVHSSHFGILADTGYLGITVWILLLLTSYRKLFKIRRIANGQIKDADLKSFYIYAATALICSQTTFILGGSFYEYGYNDVTWLTFGLVIALERLVHADVKKQDNPELSDAARALKSVGSS